jgi:putative flippase GtrA
MKLNKKLIFQFLKFGVVGVLNTGVDWLTFFLLSSFIQVFQGEGEIWAKIIAFTVAVVNSFILNSLWTFKEEFSTGLGKGQEQKLRAGSVYLGKFIIVSLIGLVINSIIFSLFRFRLGSSKLVGLIFASGAATLWNFLANKLWTYKNTLSDEKKNPAQKKYNAKWIHLNFFAAVIIIASLLICIFSMRGDSGIVDEIAHIPAGYSYDKELDFRLNPEHPPLAKAIAAAPLLFIKINNSFSDWSWNGLNQWENGWNLLYEQGNNADQILFWSRFPIVVLFALIMIYFYKWATELYGPKAGIFALALVAFSPNMIAHARLVTTDVAASFGFLISAYYLWRYYRTPTVAALIFAGLAFGFAQLLKFSAILLIPIFGVSIIIKSIIDRDKNNGFWKNFWKNLKPLFWIFAIGFVLIWAAYLVFTWNTPAEIERKIFEINLPTSGATPVRNFLTNLAVIPLCKSIAHYLLGIFMVFSHAEGGHTAFLLGNFSRTGWWYFFPVAWFFKESLPIILLTFWGLIILLIKKTRDKMDAWTITLFLSIIIIYWAISMRGSLNIGVRHLLPTLPFIYLIISRFAKPIFEGRFSFAKVALYFFAGWLVLESLFSYPKYIAYFNELRFLFGKEKHEILVDSSLDWGQDLKRLAEYVEDNHIQSIKVDYFGGGVPKYYIPQAVEWHSKYGKTSGWLAVSATFYQMSKYYGPQENQESYAYLDNLKPVSIIGDSILIFNIPSGYNQ